jgi:hypothetical protein
MVFKNLMSNVDENVDERNYQIKTPCCQMSRMKMKSNMTPLHSLMMTRLFFLRLLFDLTIWQVQKFNNGDPNLNMPLLDNDVQVFNAPPQAIHAPMAPSQDTSM